MAQRSNGKRSSPMENGDHGGKKVRDDGEVKEEVEMGHGEEEGAAAGAPAPHAAPRISLSVEASLLHCPACRLPLKPPIFEFECQVEHAVCLGCRGAGENCPACGEAATYRRCGRRFDDLIGGAKVPCPYEEHGCESRGVAYHALADHQVSCLWAPCSCPEPGCGVRRSSPAELADHFVTDHNWPESQLRYGKPLKLAVPTSQRWHVLFSQEDQRLFLLSLGALGATTAVSLVCVRPDSAAAGAPKITFKLWVDAPGNTDDFAMVTSRVVSSNLSGGGLAPAEQGMYLAVPPDLVRREVFHLNVRIDKPKTAAPAASGSLG